MSSADDPWWLVDLCGRIVLTHQLDPLLLERGLGLTRAEADAVIAGRGHRCGIGPAIHDCLPLVANILVRIEVRFVGDSAAMRQALTIPLAVLGNAAPIDLIGEDAATLHRIRRAVDEMSRPAPRWWRIGH